jgi:prevent-host-death family protein
MKPVRVSRDVVPVGEFKSKTAAWLRHASRTRQPVVITQNGRPAGVLLSPVEFDRLQEQQRFLESVASGLADADAGRVIDTDELRRRLRARRGPAR